MFKEHTKHQLYHYFYNFASTNIIYNITSVPLKRDDY